MPRKPMRRSQLLAKYFAGLEIVEAREPLPLFPIQEDFDKAIRYDPCNCGFALTAKRTCGSTAALFFKGVVYLDRLDEDEVRKVFRYETSRDVYDRIAKFDRSGLTEGIKRAFILRPPRESHTLEAHRKNNKRWFRSAAGKAIYAETKAKGRLKTAERQFEQAKMFVEGLRHLAASSTKVREAKSQQVAAQIQLEKTRNQYTAAKEKAQFLRTTSYGGTGKARHRHYDLSVRNGTGLIRKLAAQKK